MNYPQFEYGKHYSRRNYEHGLTVRINQEGKFGYFKHGELQNMAKHTSSIFKLNDFYESDKDGLAIAKEVYTSTPSGEHSDFFDAFQHGEAVKQATRIKLKRGIDKMSRFDNGAIAQTVENVKNETTDVAMITIGKLIYVNGGELIGRFVPKLTWYEKLFTSSKKRELALLVGTYVAIKAIETRYQHYLLASVSAYINFQLQTELLGGVTQETLDKIFSKFEAKDKQ